jgi:hypothetical protein
VNGLTKEEKLEQAQNLRNSLKGKAGQTALNLQNELQDRSKPSSVLQFLSELNKAIATTAGAPVDLMNFALRQVGYDPTPESVHPLSSQGIENIFSKIDLNPLLGKIRNTTTPGAILPEDKKREGYASKAGELTGHTLAALLPLAGVGSRLNTASQFLRGGYGLTPTSLKAAQNMAYASPKAMLAYAILGSPRYLAQQAGRSMTAAPVTTTAIEGAVGATAGLAGEQSARTFGEDKRIYGELVGGVSPSAVQAIAKYSPAIWAFNKVLKGFDFIRQTWNPEVTRGRVQKRILELSNDRDELIKALEEGDILKHDPEFANSILNDLTTAQRYADEGLYRLEAAVKNIQTDDVYLYKGGLDKRIESVNAAGEAEIDELLLEYGTKSIANRELEESALDYMRSLGNARIQQSIEAAQRAVSELPSTATAEEINIIVRQNIDDALKDIRAQEDDLWRNESLGKKVIVSTIGAKEALRIAIEDTPIAQRDDIPAIAKRYLGKKKEIPDGATEEEIADIKAENKSKWGDVQNVFEMQGLRSKLGELQQAAILSGDRNQARIIGNIRDGLLEDMGATAGEVTGDSGLALREALDFSRYLNETFFHGPVSKILGTSKTGDMTPETLTLEALRTAKGLKAKNIVESLIETQAKSRGAISGGIKSKIEDFLITEFKRKVFDGNVMKGPASKSFMRDYKEILDDPDLFPGLKDQIDRSIRLGMMVRPDDAAKEIISSTSPIKELNRQLENLPIKTRTEEKKALGLFFIDYILLGMGNASRVANVEPVIDGDSALRRLSQPNVAKVLEELLTGEQISRLKRIAILMSRVQANTKNEPDKITRLIKDGRAAVFQIIASVIGAKAGAFVGSYGGGGNIQTPGIFSREAKAAMKALHDPAEALLIEAILDADTFKAVMTPIIDDTGKIIPSNVKKVRQKIYAFLLGILADTDEPEYGY